MSLDQNPKLAVPLYQFKKQLANFTHKMTSCRLLKGPFISLHRRGGGFCLPPSSLSLQNRKNMVFLGHTRGSSINYVTFLRVPPYRTTKVASPNHQLAQITEKICNILHFWRSPSLKLFFSSTYDRTSCVYKNVISFSWPLVLVNYILV